MNRLAIISSFLGAAKNRYMTYQEERPLEEKFRLASQINNISGFELCYPADFENYANLTALLAQYKMGISAINFRSRRTGKWQRGSFSSALESEQKEVTGELKKAMDLAEKLGCGRITTCPLNEGHDYIFEMDYFRAYDSMEKTIGEAASHNKNIRISIEYKLNDPRARCLLGGAGETLAFCQKLGLDNVGVTLDTGHAIQAGERPAQSAVMLARAGKLFYVHLNDNDKLWDWDMIPGSYNFWDFIEFFYYLEKIGYNDWMSYDIFPKEIDMVENFNAATEITRRLQTQAAKLDSQKIEKILDNRNPAKSVMYMYDAIFGSDDFTAPLY
ncbi:MAG: sugar phosphate isomerase/epimerase [Treponema sp.]|nr:sugar phosphate isomerase/epimerase [Treponema sp.]